MVLRAHHLLLGSRLPEDSEAAASNRKTLSLVVRRPIHCQIIVCPLAKLKGNISQDYIWLSSLIQIYIIDGVKYITSIKLHIVDMS